MAKELHFQQVFETSPTALTTVTLAGESGAVPVAEVSHVIVVSGVNVNSAISYSGAYITSGTGENMQKIFPVVTVDRDVLSAAASTQDAELISSDGLSTALTGDNSTVPTLLQMFKSATEFAFTSPAFESYPLEAVVSVDVGSLVVDPLSDILAGHAPSSDESSPEVNLFEQLLAAGKINAATLAGPDGTGNATLSEGDSVSLYVRYKLVKSRKFVVDATVTAGGTATFTLGGVTITTDPASELSEESDELIKTIQWKFVQGPVSP